MILFHETRCLRTNPMTHACHCDLFQPVWFVLSHLFRACLFLTNLVRFMVLLSKWILLFLSMKLTTKTRSCGMSVVSISFMHESGYSHNGFIEYCGGRCFSYLSQLNSRHAKWCYYCLPFCLQPCNVTSQIKDKRLIHYRCYGNWPVWKWAAARQNQQNDLYAQRRLRSAWAYAQSDQSLRCPHEETLGHWQFTEHTAKTPIRLGGYQDWTESLLGVQDILLVL